MAAPHVNRRLAAIMAVDVVGYSGLVGEDDAMTALVSLTVSMVLSPFLRRRPSMLRRRNRGPTYGRYQSEVATMHWTAGWADDAS
jgi:hypothetical protein